MPDGNGLFPPVSYSPVWNLVALGILLGLAAFYLAVFLLTRKAKAPELQERTAEPIDPTVELRERYLHLIDDVLGSHVRGELGIREAHQRLSQLVRFHAYETSGVRAPQMTLADLRENELTALGDAVEAMYPGAFDRIDRADVAEAAETARRVVRAWG